MSEKVVNTGLTKARNTKIDIVKGIGIILMVFYHAGTPARDFVYMFHMALFFICSGYCYSHKSEKEPWKFIKRKIVTLYIPCFVSSFIVASLTNVFLSTHIYSPEVYSKLNLVGWAKQVLKCLAFSGGRQMIGANWFFRTLFLSLIMYMLLNLVLFKVVKNPTAILFLRAGICLLLTCIGWLAGYRFSFGKYFNCFTVMILIDLGAIAKEKGWLEKINTTVIKVVACILSFGALFGLSFIGTISINSNKIINPLFFIACSGFGFVMIYVISDFIDRFSFKVFFEYAGQKTIWIIFMHYIAFKIITFIEILILKEPIDNLSAYPTHHTGYGMWAVYGLFGVVLPLLTAIIFSKIKDKLTRKTVQ